MSSPPRVLSLDPLAARALAERGWDLGALDPDGTGLADGDVVLLAGRPGLDRLRAWRAAGHPIGAVLRLEPAEPAPGRGGLEPLALVHSTDPDELEAAISALARGQLATRVPVAGGALDPLRNTWTGPEGTVSLSALETDLLAYLAARPGREVSREELLRQVWGLKRPGQTRAVDMAISRARKKLGGTDALLASRGGGYRLVLDEPEASAGFVGRRAELARLRSLLASGTSAQLVGPPGVGKSRTAQELARQLPAVLQVDLHGVRGHDAVIARMAGTLDIGTPRSGTWSDAARSVGRRAAGHTVLLDHTETAEGSLVDVLEATGALCTWLLVGQRVHPLADAAVVVLGGLGPEDGADLLAHRAHQAGATVDREQAARLVPLLDGLPLALELAAVRSRSLSLPDLAARLDDRLTLLRDPNTGRPSHPALVDSLLAAWSRLDPALQQGLVGLSSFAGPFSLDLAEAVLGPRAVDTLAQLVDRSLVHHHDGRYRLLHAVRDVVRQTADPSALHRADAAHQRWAANEAAEARPALDDFGAADRARALVEVHAELEEAFDRAAAAREVDAVLALAPVLDVLQLLHGTERARQTLLDRTVQATEDGPPLAEGRARMLRGGAWMHTDRTGSRADLERAAELAREHGDPVLEVRAAGTLAMQDRYERGPSIALDRLVALDPQLAHCPPTVALKHRSWEAQTRSLVDRAPLKDVEDEALALIEQAARHRALGTAVAHGAWLSVRRFNEGDLRGASRVGRRVSRWVQELPDRRTRGMVLQSSAITEHLASRDYDGAVATMDRVIAAFEEVEPVRVVPARSLRGTLRLHRGDHAGAEDDLEAARAWGAAHGDEMIWTRALEQLAMLALDAGEPDRALDLLDRALDRDTGQITRLLRLHRATAQHLLGEHDASARAYDALDPTELVPCDAVLLACRRAALALHREEPDAAERAHTALAAVQAHPGEDAEPLRTLLRMLGQARPIEGRWLDPSEPDARGVEVRVLARLIRAASQL